MKSNVTSYNGDAILRWMDLHDTVIPLYHLLLQPSEVCIFRTICVSFYSTLEVTCQRLWLSNSVHDEYMLVACIQYTYAVWYTQWYATDAFTYMNYHYECYCYSVTYVYVEWKIAISELWVVKKKKTFYRWKSHFKQSLFVINDFNDYIGGSGSYKISLSSSDTWSLFLASGYSIDSLQNLWNTSI